MAYKQHQGASMTSSQLTDRIASAQRRLYGKLVALDIKALGISEYNQRYLGSKIAGLKGILQRYGRLLYLCMNNSPISPERFTLVDYGGGSGLISCLAAEMGVGTVIYNDIYDVSCADVGHLSRALRLTIDHVVCGNTDELVSYLQDNHIEINAITSYDVLEHIYDVEAHFKSLSCLSDSPFRIVHASGANIENPRYVKSVRDMQIDAETKMREKKWGHKERDSLLPFRDIRKKMILAHAPDMPPETVEELARATRGLIQADIERCVDEFLNEGRITYCMDHPTNTCDPYTGNWSEHLMEFEWIEQAVTNAGFSLEILAGRYNTCGALHKKIVKVMLNTLIRLTGRHGMRLAPYYVVNAHSHR